MITGLRAPRSTAAAALTASGAGTALAQGAALRGVADAQTNASPLLAISAQVGLKRIYKESHQIVDLVGMFKPVTKWADTVLTPQAVPEMLRNAFQVAQEERPGATYLAVPEDVEAAPMDAPMRHLTEYDGLRPSILAKTVAPGATTRFRRTRGVLPTDSGLSL